MTTRVGAGFGSGLGVSQNIAGRSNKNLAQVPRVAK